MGYVRKEAALCWSHMLKPFSRARVAGIFFPTKIKIDQVRVAIIAASK